MNLTILRRIPQGALADGLAVLLPSQRAKPARGVRHQGEYESGRKDADKRRQFAVLFDDAAKRKFDYIFV